MVYGGACRCTQQGGGLRLWAGAVLVEYDCMQCCDTMADAHGGVWWFTVMYAALAGWAARGRLGVVVYGFMGLCVQRVQWCAGNVSSVYQNTVVKTPHPLLYNDP